VSISVVIRSHNEAPRLRLTLTSLKSQAQLSEVVVVDDGSTDATADVIAEAAQFLPLMQVRHARALGRSAAANAGARAASGEILIFLDGDMPVGPNFVAAHASAHARQDVIGRGACFNLRCTRFLYDPEEAIPFPHCVERLQAISASERERMRVTRTQIEHDFASVERRARPGLYPGAGPGRLAEIEMHALRHHPECEVLWAAATGSNQSVRRDMLLAAGGFHEDMTINEHRELTLRLVRLGGQLRPVDDARCYHLTHRSGWRDPLEDTQWETLFWARHPLAEVALLPVLWASLSDHPDIPPEHRILSLPQLQAAAERARHVNASSAEEFRECLGLRRALR
jgi:cellulose synthase/poly-beta-1,6-N-acetylglucosamine synthase-like glycosyltransferase